MIHFVLGGARSGKSRFAEQQVLALAESKNKQAVYIATATAIDSEMDSRISQHQNDRGDSWKLIECPLALAEMLPGLDNNNIYLLDCLTLWLNNQLYAVHESGRTDQGQHLETEIAVLASQLAAINVDIVIVSNEIGLGVVPMGASTRLYVDHCGWLNQKVAELADKVTLVTAGIPLCIKSNDA
ncbi:bifunctional adenosylcobinamide kinase/adenosylcobinamide-phosphate guanylyltransferase [Colwellia sp. 75C3]|uniref:bifunctional adenosylcobinamide kinase/adenosylcobinamide-phosphate guanylyltransferase n=1 Tax=Colwellia sp. 75C3 TaxID=888425 RepID=UPI000C326698|nr:bifunctional adenosylcobinamide kinase/adenosylcobinamide-phosphate guanylyltransferase [Colwellia sp. 75C3]PKG85855.1 bifunctional adenosylcobinamide kinase/adenosylcobinamide-phosphate guanylyltransferase [Colwellia sp. 75C3]